MRWWKRFWILRKQNDTVKFMILFFCIGIIFLGKTLVHGARLYQAAQNPVEYGVFASTGKGTQAKLREVCQLEWVIFASPFRESTVSLGENGKELVFPCLELSEEYLETVYGISGNGAMKTFYVNQTAFALLKKAGNFGAKAKELRIAYCQQEDEGGNGRSPQGAFSETESKNPSGTAKVLLIPEPISEEEPFVCCVGDPLRLNAEEAGIRISGRPDLEGQNITKLTEAGFTLYNAQSIRTVRQEQALQGLELKYSAAIGVICLSVPFFLHSAMKMKYHRNSLE